MGFYPWDTCVLMCHLCAFILAPVLRLSPLTASLVAMCQLPPVGPFIIYLSVAPGAHAPFNGNFSMLCSCPGSTLINCTSDLYEACVSHLHYTAFLQLHFSPMRHVLAIVALQLTFQGTNPISTFSVSTLLSAVLCCCAPACFVYCRL